MKKEHVTEEFREKMRKIAAERKAKGIKPSMLGRKHSPTAKQQMSKSHTGKKFDDTHKENMSKAHEGKIVEPHVLEALQKGNQEYREKVAQGLIKPVVLSGDQLPQTGKERPPEVKQKISETGKKTRQEKKEEKERLRLEKEKSPCAPTSLIICKVK